MPEYRVPLSLKFPFPGNVTQAINPWQWTFDWAGAQFGLVNVNLGRSGDPQLEEEILDEVGSYGRQLGRIGDVLEILLEDLDRNRLNDKQRDAVDALRGQLAAVRALKRRRADATAGKSANIVRA
jgi:hypothetical protein